MRAIMGISE